MRTKNQHFSRIAGRWIERPSANRKMDIGFAKLDIVRAEIFNFAKFFRILNGLKLAGKS